VHFFPYIELFMYKGWAIRSSPCTAIFNDLLCSTRAILLDLHTVIIKFSMKTVEKEGNEDIRFL
jgi:hypothetical protein